MKIFYYSVDKSIILVKLKGIVRAYFFSSGVTILPHTLHTHSVCGNPFDI